MQWVCAHSWNLIPSTNSYLIQCISSNSCMHIIIKQITWLIKGGFETWKRMIMLRAMPSVRWKLPPMGLSHVWVLLFFMHELP